MPNPDSTGQGELDLGVIEFGRPGRRRVEGRFDGGSMTSDAGVMLLLAADRALGLTAAAARCISDPRNPLLITRTRCATCCASGCTVWRWAGRT